MKFRINMWNIIFLTIVGGMIWIGSDLTAKMIMYIRFNNEVEGNRVHSGVLQYSDDINHICVDYTFDVKSQNFSAQHMYQKPVYKSKDAAELVIADKKIDKLRVWYWEQEDGKPISSLERNLPINDFVRLSVLTGILLYFQWLRRYFDKFKEDKSQHLIVKL